MSRLRELEKARLLRHDRALVLGTETRHELGDESAGLLGVEITHLLGHVDQRGDDLVMALLVTRQHLTAWRRALRKRTIVEVEVLHKLQPMMRRSLLEAAGDICNKIQRRLT